MAVAVHVIAGFLGAGKTTVMRQLLRRFGDTERVAIIVNDFGDSGFDAEALGGSGATISEIPGGCVCCTAPEGFQAAVAALLDEVQPQRILVEPTGLAHTEDIVDTLRRAPYADRLDLRPVVVLVDPTALPDGPVPGLLREQAEAADVLLATRADVATAEQLARFDALADSLWPAPMLRGAIAQGELPTGALSWPQDAASAPTTEASAHSHADPHHHGPGHAHGHVVRSLRWDRQHSFQRDRLVDALAQLSTGRAGAPLARLKGVFLTDQGVWRLEVAGSTVTERSSGYRRDSRVDIILSGSEQAPLDAAQALVEAALLTDEERQVDGRVLEVALPDGRVRRFDRAAVMALPEPIADVSSLVPGRQGAAARMRHLLARAEVPQGLLAVVVAADGMTTAPVPVEELLEGVLLHSLDGEPLPSNKGGPFRLLIPGEAGRSNPCGNVKGVVRVALRDPS